MKQTNKNKTEIKSINYKAPKRKACFVSTAENLPLFELKVHLKLRQVKIGNTYFK